MPKKGRQHLHKIAQVYSEHPCMDSHGYGWKHESNLSFKREFLCQLNSASRYGSLLCFSDDDFSSLIWATATCSVLAMLRWRAMQVSSSWEQLPSASPCPSMSPIWTSSKVWRRDPALVAGKACLQWNSERLWETLRDSDLLICRFRERTPKASSSDKQGFLLIAATSQSRRETAGTARHSTSIRPMGWQAFTWEGT